MVAKHLRPKAIQSRIIAPIHRSVATTTLVVLFMLAGGAPDSIGEVVWDGPGVVVCLIAALGLLTAASFMSRFPSVRLGKLAQVVALGLILLLMSRASWLALEIVLGGRGGSLARYGLGMLLGAAVGAMAAGICRTPGSTLGRWARNAIVSTLWVSALVGTALFVTETGPHDVTRYPPPMSSPYRLPWHTGVRHLCVQGNRGIVSHRGGEEFAYDFAMPIGSDVCAARSGRVVFVDVSHDGNGITKPNNQVLVDHGDGTIGWYLHLIRGGTRVHVGDRVARGQVIAASGNVGRSMLPHLHFQVTDTSDATMPITFADVAGDGIPRMFRRF